MGIIKKEHSYEIGDVIHFEHYSMTLNGFNPEKEKIGTVGLLLKKSIVSDKEVEIKIYFCSWFKETKVIIRQNDFPLWTYTLANNKAPCYQLLCGDKKIWVIKLT